MIAKLMGIHRADADAEAALMAHIKYILYRVRGPGEPKRDLFNAEGTVTDRHAAARAMQQHFGRGIAYQKLVLSPKSDERAHLDAQGAEGWRTWTRAVMKDLGQRVGKNLQWVATKHMNTAHPHVHVVVAGKGIPQPHAQRSGSGKVRGEHQEVQFRPADFRAAERSGREHAGIHERPEIAQQLQLFRDQDRVIFARDRTPAHERDISHGGRDR